MTENGKPRFNLVRQRNGGKFVVKKMKIKKDHSFRDEMASLALKVRRKCAFNHPNFLVYLKAHLKKKYSINSK